MSLFRRSLIFVCLLGTFLNCRAFENNYFKQKHVIKRVDRPIRVTELNQEPETVSTENNLTFQPFDFDAKYDEINAYVGLSKVWIFAKENGKKTKIFTIKDGEKKKDEMDYQANDMFINQKNKENVSFSQSAI